MFAMRISRLTHVYQVNSHDYKRFHDTVLSDHVHQMGKPYSHLQHSTDSDSLKREEIHQFWRNIPHKFGKKLNYLDRLPSCIVF